MLIRPFRSDDLPALQRIATEAFSGVSIDEGMEKLYGPINGHDWRWRKARSVAEDADRDPSGIFVAEDESGAILGFISSWQDAEAGLGHIPNIALVPQARGQGLGRKLIAHVMDHFRGCGLTHAKIETLEQNAIGGHLYPSLGFREVARQIHMVADLTTDATVESGDDVAGRENTQ